MESFFPYARASETLGLVRNKDIAMLDTLSEEEIAHTLEMSPASFADLAQTVAQNPNSTIEPPLHHSSTAGRRALAALGGHTEGIVGGLDLGATIGQGGMGIVRTATQRSLGRTVAVKTLRAEVKTEQATLRLLREAWVTGALEHPNIVPIYDLGLGDDGTPIIVLKQIEGLTWADLIADAAGVKARFGATDLLEHNLRILIQLCNAVSLAHARGIVHRDLKPENVMIGRFGEVYLVDWGIAVSLRDDPTGRMPLASEAAEMAGTPSYMAPEMLGAMGKLGERTDVYLLGAILHEIVTGKPPHVGDGFRQIVVSILLSQFTFPDDVPTELAEIASRAMSRAAEARFASADELRLKIEGYLRQRGSLVLSAEAAARVSEMREVITNGGVAGDVRDRIHHLFAEARFGFRQAIRASDDNLVARAGLQEATEIVVVFELAEGTPEAAAAALAELVSPPAALAKSVADALRTREAGKRRVAELEQLSAELDPSTGRRTRIAVAGMVGVVWTVNPELFAYFFRHDLNQPYWSLYLMSVGLLVMGGLAVFWGRESLWKTAVNRRMLAISVLMFAAQLTLQVGGRLLGLSYAVLWPLHIFCWFMAEGAFAIVVDRRFLFAVLVALLAFLYAAARPAHVFHAMAVSNFALLVNFMVAWSRPDEDGDFFVRRIYERFEGRRRPR